MVKKINRRKNLKKIITVCSLLLMLISGYALGVAHHSKVFVDESVVNVLLVKPLEGDKTVKGSPWKHILEKLQHMKGQGEEKWNSNTGKTAYVYYDGDTKNIVISYEEPVKTMKPKN
jgi:hypothetical protein